MKHSPIKYRSQFLITVAVIVTAICLSCENKTEIIPKSDFLILPTNSAKNFKTVVNDTGKVQLIMSAPLMEQFDNKDLPYSEFRYGIKVEFFDGQSKPKGIVTSKYAKYNKTTDLWELKDSVIVINENNDKLETEVLNWNQAKDLIYTDRFVKITNVDQVIQGFGFESDSHLRHRRIKKVSATIYFNDEE